MAEAVEITVTAAKLAFIANCGYRMLSYIKPGDSRLLAVLQSSEGFPVKVMLGEESEKRSSLDSS